MTDVIRDLKVEWNWKGDEYALEGFNIAITDSNMNPDELMESLDDGSVIDLVSVDADTRNYTFEGEVINTDDKSEIDVYIQPIYPDKKGGWLRQDSNVPILPDNYDGEYTVNTIKNHNELAGEVVNYTTDGVPDNLVSPTDITSQTNSDGSLDIKLKWGQYSQPTKDTEDDTVRKADLIILFSTVSEEFIKSEDPPADDKIWLDISDPDNSVFKEYVDGSWVEYSLGEPNINDSAITFNVNEDSDSYHLYEGLPATRLYSFGIAAGRKTEEGLQVNEIQTVDQWTDVNIKDPFINHDSVPSKAADENVIIDERGITVLDGRIKITNSSDPADAQTPPSHDDVEGVKQYATSITEERMRLKPDDGHLWHFDKHLTSTDGIKAEVQ